MFALLLWTRCELKYYCWQTILQIYTCIPFHQFFTRPISGPPLAHRTQSCSRKGVLSFSYVVTQLINTADSQMEGVPYGLNRRRKSETLRVQYIDVKELRYGSRLLKFSHFLDLNFLTVCFSYVII